jgi:hypothetical protein
VQPSQIVLLCYIVLGWGSLGDMGQGNEARFTQDEIGGKVISPSSKCSQNAFTLSHSQPLSAREAHSGQVRTPSGLVGRTGSGVVGRNILVVGGELRGRQPGLSPARGTDRVGQLQAGKRARVGKVLRQLSERGEEASGGEMRGHDRYYKRHSLFSPPNFFCTTLVTGQDACPRKYVPSGHGTLSNDQS